MASSVGLLLGGAGAAALLAAPFTGGASLYLYAAGFALIAGSAVMSATPQEQEASTGVGRRVSMTADPEAPWEWVYGDVVKGGHVAWAGIAGSRDQLMGIDIVLACHPCEELIAIQVGEEWTFPLTTNHLGNTDYSGLGLILNADRLTNPGGTAASLFEYPDDWYVPVSGSEWFRYDQTQNGDRDEQSEDGSTKKAHIALKVSYGTQTATNAFMATKFAGYGDVDRKFIGHTVVHLILRGHSELGTLGGIPQLKFRIRGKNDIALDGTGTPSGYTANCAAVLADYMREQIAIGPSHILNHDGGGLSSLIAECADTTWHSSGGEARYEFHGVIRDDADLIETCNLIASHMLGGYSERGDDIVFWTGKIGTPWSDGPLGVNDFAGPVETTQPDEDDWVNTLQPHFVPRSLRDDADKIQLYGRMEPTISQATSATYVTEDGEVTLRQDVKFEGCPLSRRAVWMAQCILDERRLGAQYTRRFRKRALVLEIGDIYEIEDPERLSGAVKFRLVHKSAPDPVNFTVELTGQRYNDAIYTQGTVSEDALGVVPKSRRAIMPVPTGLATTLIGSGRVGADGRMTVDVQFTWDDPANVLVLTTGSIEIEWKLAAQNWPGRSDKAGAASLSEVIPGFLDGATYHVRARFIGHSTAGRTDRPIGDWTDPPLTFIPSLAAGGIYRPIGPPLGGRLGVNILSDPYMLWPYDSTDGDGVKLGGYTTVNAGGSNPVTGSAEVVTGVGYWSVDRNGTIVKTALNMTINGDASDSARLNVLEFIPVSPGQIYQIGCSLAFGSTGKIRVQMLLYDDAQSFIANSSRVVIDVEAAGKTAGKWYHKSAPYQVQPVGGVLPSFVRYQFRQIRYDAFSAFDEVVSIDGLLLVKINRAAAPYDADEEFTIDGTSVGSNYQFIKSFGLPKTPQGGPFYASGDQEFSFEFTCDAQVAVASTTSGAATTWAEFRMMLLDGTYPAWQANTAYVIGDRVRNRATNSVLDRTYQCDTNGTSAGSGGPTGTTANITDNTTRWDYVEDTPQVLISKNPNKPYSRLVTATSDTTAVKSNWSPVRLHPTYTPAAGFWIIRPQARLTPSGDGGDPDHTKINIRDIKLRYEINENEATAASE